ncbi:MAG: VanZ family protein [Candidatus Komeilibacteria bacterium]|jgi:VanZ family protein|nr:VanZ family protein [Candidatus Komeilibacteria bacterium]MBT4447924.1 VanZ family protein [Candidatus Komeilibacteria bacterium]
MISAKQKKQLLFLLLAALWGYLIFYLSDTPDLATNLPYKYDFVLRKLAHMFVFMVLTYLIASSMDSKQRHYLLFVIVAAIVYAFVDELHQSYVQGRVGSGKDILVDSVGVYIGVWLYKVRPPNKLFKFIK